MGDDAPKTERIAKSNDPNRRTFRPFSASDRFERRVREDHAPNAALHSALKASDQFESVNLVGSHDPSQVEREGAIRYHVRVTIENGGMGDADLGATMLNDMIRDGFGDDVVVTGAWSQSLFQSDDGDPTDPEAIVEGHVDRLVVTLRPVETKVEPIEVKYSDLPDDVAYSITDSGEAVKAYRCHGCERLTLPYDFAEIDDEPACPRCGTRVDWDKTTCGDPDPGGFDDFPEDAPGYDEDDDTFTEEDKEAIRSLFGEDDPDDEYVDGIECPECGDPLRLSGTEPTYACNECGAMGDTDDVDGFPDTPGDEDADGTGFLFLGKRDDFEGGSDE